MELTKLKFGYSKVLYGKDQNYDLKDILERIEGVKAIVQPFSRVAVSISDEIDFIGAFLALCELEKEIILLPNMKSSTTQKFQNEYDFLLEEVKKVSTNQDSITMNPNTLVTMFTSGSQGKPKKISKNLNSLILECENLEERFGNRVGDSLFCATVSHQHIYGLIFKILWPLLKNRSLILKSLLYPEELKVLMAKERSISLVSSPAFLKRLEQNDFNHQPSEPLRMIFSSGGKLETQFAKAVNDIFSIFPVEIYGSTETGGIAYRTQVESQSWTAFDMVELSQDLRGCLKVVSPFSVNGLFQTEDLVEFDSVGQFLLKGRVDRVVKIEEKRVSLVEMEQCLKSFSYLVDAHCAVVFSGNREVIGCLLVENREIEELSKIEKVKKIKKDLSQHFEAILLPKKFRFLKELPYNQESKLKKEEVLRYFND